LEIIGKVFKNKKIPFRTLHGGHNTTQREAAVDWLMNADIRVEHYCDKIWLSEISDSIAPVEDGEDIDIPEESDLNGRVLLVSLKAGGVGLNLVAANVVYLTDLWWNPSVEEQAFQRVHRLGQTRKVFTYKLVCDETIDERILDLQKSKSDMTNDVLGDGVPGSKTSASSRKLTLEDIRQLFKPSITSSF
jgi:SNF2 family DNA or RNA helicase